MIILDGGVGHEINKRSSRDKSHPLWSVKVMYEEPEVVIGVHRDYILAGAQVHTLNTYTATPTRCPDLYKDAAKRAYNLLQEAIHSTDNDGQSLLVAGCLPPLIASYSNDAWGAQKSYDQYCHMIDAQEGVDLFIVETMSNIEEAAAAIKALKSFGHKANISFTAKVDLNQALELEADMVLVNCLSPEEADIAVDVLKKDGRPFGAYANGFTFVRPFNSVDELKIRKDLTPEEYAKHAAYWIDCGASLIGGCCGIGPEFIKEISH